MQIASLVTAPAKEPLTLEEVKGHLRLTHGDHDTLLGALIQGAREWAEAFTHRALITQTWDLYLDGFPSVIEVQKPPLQSVTAASFTYVDSDGDTTQVPTSVYTVDTDATPGRVYPAYNQVWPVPRDQPKAVVMRFVAGYGDDEGDVPEPLRTAMKLHVENLYDHSGASEELMKAAERLAMPYVIPGF